MIAINQSEKYIELLTKAVNNHAIYVWGAQGELVKDLLASGNLKNMEPNPKNFDRVKQHIAMLDFYGWLTKKTRAYDCSGLVCYCLVKAGREESGFDLTADQLAKRYRKVEQPTFGSLLHRPGHIGTYIGFNNLIEAKGRDYGVVVSPFKASDWTDYCNPFDA